MAGIPLEALVVLGIVLLGGIVKFSLHLSQQAKQSESTSSTSTKSDGDPSPSDNTNNKPKRNRLILWGSVALATIVAVALIWWFGITGLLIAGAVAIAVAAWWWLRSRPSKATDKVSSSRSKVGQGLSWFDFALFGITLVVIVLIYGHLTNTLPTPVEENIEPVLLWWYGLGDGWVKFFKVGGGLFLLLLIFTLLSFLRDGNQSDSWFSAFLSYALVIITLGTIFWFTLGPPGMGFFDP